MKKVGKIVIKPDSDFWKDQKKTTNQEAEEAAKKAAEQAKREVLERAAKREAETKAYLDSLRYVGEMKSKFQPIRDKLAKIHDKIDSLKEKLVIEYEKSRALYKEIQESCTHDEVMERTTKYTDEYDQWHEGHSERRCIECRLVEESSYSRYDRLYLSGNKKYNKLENSKVVLVRSRDGDKEFQLEFDDRIW